MTSRRITRVNEVLKREVAESMYRLLGEGELNLAAVTITRVETSEDLRHARIFVSVMATEGSNAPRVVETLNGMRQSFVKEVHARVRLKYTPRLEFVEDQSLRKGDDVLEMITELEDEHPEWHQTPSSTAADESGADSPDAPTEENQFDPPKDQA